MYVLSPCLVYFVTGSLYLLKIAAILKVATMCHFLYIINTNPRVNPWEHCLECLSSKCGWLRWLTPLCVSMGAWTWTRALGSFPWFLHEVVTSWSPCLGFQWGRGGVALEFLQKPVGLGIHFCLSLTCVTVVYCGSDTKRTVQNYQSETWCVEILRVGL